MTMRLRQFHDFTAGMVKFTWTNPEDVVLRRNKPTPVGKAFVHPTGSRKDPRRKDPTRRRTA